MGRKGKQGKKKQWNEKWKKVNKMWIHEKRKKENKLTNK